jgi:hypothetical protein
MTASELQYRHRLALPRWARSGYRPAVFWAVVGTVAAVAVMETYKYVWTNQAPARVSPDASVLLSTFITVYGVFIAAYGVLTGFAIAMSERATLRLFTLIVLVEATLFDLYRIFNTTNDLYTNVIGKLTVFDLHDDVHDFIGYFALNAAVTALTLVIAAMGADQRRKRPRTITASTPTRDER